MITINEQIVLVQEYLEFYKTIAQQYPDAVLEDGKWTSESLIPDTVEIVNGTPRAFKLVGSIKIYSNNTPDPQLILAALSNT